jgi:hypothetical protein
MSGAIIGFIIGFISGSVMGVISLALLVASKDED